MAKSIILHGGNSDKKSRKNDRFFREIISSINGENVLVLCVYFARPQERWEASYAEDQSIFRALGIETVRNIDTKMADYRTDDLLKDISEADVIFINGGFKGHLKETLLQIGVDKFRKMTKDKVLVGISAGANILGKYYYSQAVDGIREGIGLLDIKILTHFSSGSTKQLELLRNYKEELPVVTIAEEEYVVI